MSATVSSPTRPLTAAGDPATFKLRKSITLGDPKSILFPTIACPDSSFVTRIDIRTADSGASSPIRQFVKGLRIHCSSDPQRARGSIHWDSGTFNDSSDGPSAAKGIHDVVVGAGAVIDHIGYAKFVKGNANAAWRQADVTDLRACVLSEVGGSTSAGASTFLASVTLGFVCPDVPASATTTLTATRTADNGTAQAGECATGLSVGAIIGIVAGFAAINIVAITSIVIRLGILRRKKQDESDAAAWARSHGFQPQGQGYEGQPQADVWKPPAATQQRPMSEELILAPPPAGVTVQAAARS